MNAVEMRKVFDAFDRVRCAPPEEREHALSLELGLTPSMIKEVRSLLEHDSPTSEFMGEPPSVAALAFARHAQSIATPETIGPYRIVRMLGRGGFGTVFLAEEASPRRLVALKVMRPAFTPSDVRRMEFEAESLARLSHPGIARVYATGVSSEMAGSPYIAMEYVEGEPLDVHVRRAELSVPQSIQLLVLLCNAVEHAHRNGVVHRDLAPKNILVDSSGQPKVLDFGLAYTSDRGASLALTAEGHLVGTLRYMSPEQLGGHAIRADTRADVYALGVIAYELLTGRHPYLRDDNAIGIAARDLMEAVAARPASLSRELGGDINVVLLKAIERDPDRRYQSALELRDDLQAVLAQKPVQAIPASTAYVMRRFVARHRLLSTTVGLAAMIIVCCVVGLGILYSRAVEERSRAVSSSNAAVPAASAAPWRSARSHEPQSSSSPRAGRRVARFGSRCRSRRLSDQALRGRRAARSPPSRAAPRQRRQWPRFRRNCGCAAVRVLRRLPDLTCSISACTPANLDRGSNAIWRTCVSSCRSRVSVVAWLVTPDRGREAAKGAIERGSPSQRFSGVATPLPSVEIRAMTAGLAPQVQSLRRRTAVGAGVWATLTAEVPDGVRDQAVP